MENKRPFVTKKIVSYTAFRVEGIEPFLCNTKKSKSKSARAYTNKIIQGVV